MNKVLDKILAVISTILDCIFSFISMLFPTERKTEFNADFIPASNILSTFNKGFCLNGTQSLSIKDSYSNALVIGGSSSGKSSKILIPSILKMMGSSSLIINDPSKELYLKTASALSQAGYSIKIINYSDVSISETYNPLHRITTISDIQKISKILVINAFGQSSDFWNISAESLIALFVRYVVYYQPKEYRTLTNVLQVINTLGYAPDKVDRLMAKTNDASLIAEYKTFVAYSDKTLMSIVATCRAALTIFSDPSVAAVTSANDTVNFEIFRTQKTALFINNSVKDMRYYSVISSIFFEQFWGEIMSKLGSPKELPIFFLLDECSSLYLNSLPITCSNIRKSNSGLLLVFQAYSQIVDIYNNAQAKSIAANCYSKVYMPGVPIEVAKELETTFGFFEFDDEKKIKHKRLLMSADEIRQSLELFILCGNFPPIRTKATPYFEQFRLSRLASLPPYIPAKKTNSEILQSIQFDSDE